MSGRQASEEEVQTAEAGLVGIYDTPCRDSHALRDFANASFMWSEEIKSLLPPMSRSERLRFLIGYYVELLWWGVTGRV